MPKPTFQLPAHRRWTTDDATRVLAAVETSGKSLPEFAREHGLHAARLERWSRRLTARPHAPTDFHEVSRHQLRAVDVAAHATFDVVLPRGTILRFGVSIPIERVLDIVSAFEAAHPC